MLLLSTPIDDLRNSPAFADKRFHLSRVEHRQWHAYNVKQAHVLFPFCSAP